MKKIKKKFIYLFLTVAVSFIGILNAFADSSDFESGKRFNVPVGSDLPYTIPYSSNPEGYTPRQYTAKGESGESYNAYCLDPQLQAYAGTYSIVTDLSEEYKAGVSAIMAANGEYESTRIALVAFSYVIAKPSGMNTGASSRSNSLLRYDNNDPHFFTIAIINSGIKWACQDSNSVSALTGISGDCEQSLRSLVKSKYGSSYSSDTVVLSDSTYASAAQSLFAQGLAAAAAAKNGDNSTSSDGFVLDASLDEVSKEDTEVIIPATFKFEGVKYGDFLKNINFECPNCSANGYSLEKIEYSINNGEWQSLENNSDTNLLESVISSSEDGENAEGIEGVINLKITLSKAETSSDEEECEPTSFTISYKYSGSSKYNVAIIIPNQNDGQNYLAAMSTGEDEQSEKEGKLEGEIPCDKEVCETKISTPICEEDGGSDIIAPEEIKKCILDNVDDAGNSYQLTSGNGGVDNNYCKVFCKEDYKDVMPQGDSSYGIILQPKIEDVVCGGYFKLNAHVEGQKDCYTGGNTTDSDSNGEGSIDKDLYIETIKQIQNDMTDAMTDYNEAESQLKGIDAATPKETQLTCNGTTYTLFDVTVKWDNYTQYKFEWDEENEIPKVTDSEGGSGNVSYSDSSITCNAIYEDGKKVGEEISAQPSAKEQYEQWKSEVNNNKTQAEQTMTSKLEEYKKEINAYNSCLTAWTMDYKFAQKLQFYYDETQGSLNDFSASIPYYSLLKDDQKYLEAVEDTYGEETEVIVCKETASEEYVCEGDSTSFELSVEELASVNIDEYGYDSTYGSAFESKDYVICNPDEGCKTDPREISQASFVKKTIRKTQDYITPTVFYQIEANGKITVNSGYAGDDVKLEALENALPISTKAVVGGTFRLMLEDLGEFYDSGEVGRLIDYQGDNESRSVANALGYNSEEGFDGNYECYYTSPCKPDDCPNCEFIGTPLEICPNCDFTPCVNCVFNLDELQINVKPITNTDVVSVDRDYGYNWIVNTTLEELTLLSQKAEQTIHEIEEDNDLVYNSTKVSDGSGLAFSIKLDSAVISKIREYNKAAEGEGGYGNDSLTCYDAQIGDDVVKNVYCYSELIDQLLSMSDIQDKVPSDIYDIRVSESQRSDENNAANGGSTNGYWKLWTDETLNMENISGTGWSYANVGYDDKTGQADIIGGPAWR
ncbi:MAG: hypothetical protein ACLUFU_00965 [Bacilli bacterium]